MAELIMHQFDNINDKSKKETYIELILKKRFNNEFDTFGNDFINDVAMKMDIRGANIEMLFIAYLCYMNAGIKKLEFKSDIIINKIKEYSKISIWYNMIKSNDYSIDSFYQDILMYLIMVTKYIKYTDDNYEFNESDEDIEIY